MICDADNSSLSMQSKSALVGNLVVNLIGLIERSQSVEDDIHHKIISTMISLQLFNYCTTIYIKLQYTISAPPLPDQIFNRFRGRIYPRETGDVWDRDFLYIYTV